MAGSQRDSARSVEVEDGLADENEEDFEDDSVTGDADAMVVSLRAGSSASGPFADVYAHRERGEPTESTQEPAVHIARVTTTFLSMHPVVSARHRHDFLEPKYPGIDTILIPMEIQEWSIPETVAEFDGLLGDLPAGFVRHARFGLGFKWDYRQIALTVAALNGVNTIDMPASDQAEREGEVFTLGLERFDALRRQMDTITRRARARARKEREVAAYNGTAHASDPAQHPEKHRAPSPGELAEVAMLQRRSGNSAPADRQAAIELVKDDAPKIAKERPEELLHLREAIEHVTLAELVEKMEATLRAFPRSERKWQELFSSNPFILSLAFAHPMVYLQGQAYVGGTAVSRSGASVADFLAGLGPGSSLAIVEIKTPSTKLVMDKPYRGDLHAPSGDLTAAMAQALEQRLHLTTSFFTLAGQDEALRGSTVAAVQCVVIAGMFPKDKAMARSLEIFRHSAKDITVITFDELLQKLRHLHSFLAANKTP